MPENIIPGFTDKIDAVLEKIDAALDEWEGVKGGDFTEAMVERGNAIIAELLNGAK